MKIEYDKDVDAAYIYLDDSINDLGIKKTIELNGNIILDFGGDNKLIGMEVLDASKVLNKKLLSSVKG